MAENIYVNEKWAVGTKVVALYTFDGNDPEDLPFNEGDVLTITSTTDDHTWYYGRRSDGKVGMIPSNYIKERGEGTEKVTIVPQIPPRAQSGRMYVPEQGKAPAAEATEREERELYENTKLSHPADSYTSEWPPGTEVVAQLTFAGYDPEDLPFNERDVLTIIKPTRDPARYLARRGDGEVGMIPSNFVVQERGKVKALLMPWFHGNLKRERAEELLQPREDGMFLVRWSSNYPGDYTLCLCSGGYVEHYHIICKENTLTIDDVVIFENLYQLIEHYKESADGLVTRLTKPMASFGKQHYSVNKQEFVDQGWVIKKKDLKLGDITAKGQFKDTPITKGEYNDQKIIVRSHEHSCKTEQQFLMKAAIMTNLRHPNVIELIGVVLCKPVYIVTESMDKGSLLEYLQAAGSAIQKREQISFATDICNGMACLEEKKIVHRELCTANVLVFEDGSAKVAGLGRARYADSDMTGGKIRFRWTAPEALGTDGKYTNKSDMWSFGILLWEIYSRGLEPYPGMSFGDVIDKVVDNRYTMAVPADCPSDVCDIVRQAWQFDLLLRPCFSDVKFQLTDIQRAMARTQSPTFSFA